MKFPLALEPSKGFHFVSSGQRKPSHAVTQKQSSFRRGRRNQRPRRARSPTGSVISVACPPWRVIRGLEDQSMLTFKFGLMQIVHFHERNSGGVVYPTHDGGVVTRWEVCNDRGFACVRRSVAAVLNILDLVLGDDAAEAG